MKLIGYGLILLLLFTVALEGCTPRVEMPETDFDSPPLEDADIDDVFGDPGDVQPPEIPP